ncbi:MAG TPA: protein kinase [Gemmatimonadaceae bacterium]|nr:protein kinase [Gemmatimonadaceae bacterium]
MTETADRLAAALADRYRLVRELGQGGMATVYLAEDLKHDRKVALKVLKPELAAVIGGERFVVEIKTTAALQHPHILPLFDSGTVDGFLYYVMPYIEGETLRDKLNRETQLGIDEAVRITSEVADALDYAHRHGVIHRDIKPENILLHDGRPMVADFGIALALSAAAGGRMTETGMSLGTPHYMSPEQATADKDISNRSDIYSLGSVLYEMLTGEPPHMGTSAQQIIMKIVTEEAAPVTRLRKSVPPNVAAAVAKAVERLPADRFETAKAFADALNDPGFATLTITGGSVAGRRTRGPRVVIGIAAASVAVALAAGWMIGRRGGDPGSVGPADVVHATLGLADSVAVPAIASMRLAISPSGRRIAFVGEKGGVVQLWVRDLGDDAAHPLADTEGALDPFFSPDGESIGFYTGTGSRGTLKVVSFSGGVVRTVVSDSVPLYGGGSWGDDGRIYFTYSANLASVSAAGGPVTVIARPDSQTGGSEFDFPEVLPGSHKVLMMVYRGSVGASRISVVDLATRRVTDLTPGTIARYVAPGYLAIGVPDGRVLAARFDVASARLTSTPMPILEGVQAENTNGSVQFAVSSTGAVIYERQGGGSGGIVWVDRTGAITPVDTSLRGAYQDPMLSPDGTQFVVVREEAGATQVWVKQLPTGAFTRLTSDPGNADRPDWSPDGRRVVYLATVNGVRSAFTRRADGTDSERPVLPSRPKLDEVEFGPLGRVMLFRTLGAAVGSRHLLVAELGKDTVPRLLIQSRFDHYAMRLSPDGRWLAYVSEESGNAEVYVRPFPNVDSARIAISVGGGVEPLWSRDGTELFFRGQRGEMFATPVTTGAQFTHGSPKLLFRLPALIQDLYHRAYSVTPDGKRFLMVASGGDNAADLNVILNWRVELQRLTENGK